MRNHSANKTVISLDISFFFLLFNRVADVVQVQSTYEMQP